jgi:threonine/homoserine/homoserine lactone efflux protein
MDASTIALFAVAAVAVLLVPGPAVLFIVTRSVEHGRPAALALLAGIHLGTSVHVIAAAVGLSAVIAASPTAYDAVRYLGAAYLIVVGVRALLRRGDDGSEPRPPRPASRRRLLVEGIVVNVLNPKMALFFLAFMPQFVDPSRGSASVQVLVLGAVFVLLGLVTDGTYALVAATVGQRVRARGGVGSRVRYLSGGIFIGLGLLAALSGQRVRRSAG